MTDPKVEEIRARLDHPHVGDIDHLLTKLDEAEKARDIQTSYSDVDTQTAADALGRAIAAEQRERDLIAGIREAQGYIEKRTHPDDWGVPCVYVDGLIPILSRLLPTPTEEGESHE